MIRQKGKQMSKRPRFKDLIPLFETNSDFSITEDQYEKMTGAPLPKGTYYQKIIHQKHLLPCKMIVAEYRLLYRAA